jgi:hypothetical protein
LKSKFGDRRGEVSAAWLISRIAIRSNRGAGGERLGYLKGGYQHLIDRLQEEVTGRGGSIMLDSPVREIRREGRGWLVNGDTYDCVVSTLPPQVTADLTGLDIARVPYQGAACMTLALDRDVTDGIILAEYEGRGPLRRGGSHTNFAPLAWYGEHLVYLAYYFTGRLPEGFERSMLADFLPAVFRRRRRGSLAPARRRPVCRPGIHNRSPEPPAPTRSTGLPRRMFSPRTTGAEHERFGRRRAGSGTAGSCEVSGCMRSR